MDFVQIVSQNRKWAVALCVVLVIAIPLYLLFDSIESGGAKEIRAQQEARMAEAVQKYDEDLLRAQTSADAAFKARLAGTFNQFLITAQYDVAQINATLFEYGPQNVSGSNFADKLAAGRKFALQVNEYSSHIDGLKQFFLENVADFNRLGTREINQTAATAQLDSSKAFFKKAAGMLADDLESFAKTSASRTAAASETIALLRQAEESP